MKALIMAGGQGTRFWPLSRARYPKQFLKLFGDQSLLQETFHRLTPLLSPRDVYIVSSAPYVELIRSQLPQLSADQIIVEPSARNTAPCIGLAAQQLQKKFPDEVMAVLPSDHLIKDVREFQDVLKAAEALAREGWLVTFAIQPRFPATGYGYLERGKEIGKWQGQAAHTVSRFTEKPDLDRAESFVSQGGYYWNSGMFVWSISTILSEISRHLPELHHGLAEIDRKSGQAAEISKIFSSLAKVSIDFGVMEKSEKVAMIPCDLGWNDVGTWKALEDVREGDSSGVVANSPVISVDSSDSIVFSSAEKVIALLGVSDLVVVETSDAILVCDKNRTEEVRKIIDRLEGQNLENLV